MALSLVPGEDRARILKFRFERDQKLALASRLLQRSLVSQKFGIPHDAVQIARTAEGKPYVENAEIAQHPVWPNWNFNVSHHGAYAAIASEPILVAGIDIMDLHERPHNETTSVDDFLSTFTNNFTAGEWSAIQSGAAGFLVGGGGGDDTPQQQQQQRWCSATTDSSSPQRTQAIYDSFYAYWSLKEAYIKSVGIGLGFELNRADFSLINHEEEKEVVDEEEKKVAVLLGDKGNTNIKPCQQHQRRKYRVSIDAGPQEAHWTFSVDELRTVGNHHHHHTSVSSPTPVGTGIVCGPKRCSDGSPVETHRHVVCVARGSPAHAIVSYRNTLPCNGEPLRSSLLSETEALVEGSYAHTTLSAGLKLPEPSWRFVCFEDLVPLERRGDLALAEHT
jgi:phosphopantetheinyl transferase